MKTKYYYIKPEIKVLELEIQSNVMINTSVPISAPDDPYVSGEQTDVKEFDPIGESLLKLPHF